MATDMVIWNLFRSLNQPSLDKFAPVVKVGGSLVVNSDLCTVGEVKEGVKVYNIPANTIAVDNFGSAKLANLVMLGAVVYATGAIDVNGMDDTFAHVFEGGKAKFIPDNKKAFELGYEAAKNA